MLAQACARAHMIAVAGGSPPAPSDAPNPPAMFLTHGCAIARRVGRCTGQREAVGWRVMCGLPTRHQQPAPAIAGAASASTDGAGGKPGQGRKDGAEGCETSSGTPRHIPLQPPSSRCPVQRPTRPLSEIIEEHAEHPADDEDTQTMRSFL